MADGVDSPNLVDGTDLKRWADQRSAQADLPRLARRIIRQESDQVQRVDATRIWLSELLDMPALGAATIEEWWRRFSNGFDPRLTAEVVLAGREDHAAELLRRLSADVGRTFIKAASVDDGLAFAACAMIAQRVDKTESMLS